jgi:hypothetical protein
LAIGTPKDFTVEVWFRPNPADAVKGRLQTLIEKLDASGHVRFGIGVTDRSARIVLNGIAQEVHWPSLLHPEHFTNNNQTYTYTSGGRTYTPPLSTDWRLLSATFRWAASQQTTLAYVHMDDEKAATILRYEGVQYSEGAGTVVVGRGFEGVIRSVIVYRGMLKCSLLKVGSGSGQWVEETFN